MKLSPDCGDLEHPYNGSVTTDNGTTFGQFARYSCNFGFELNGNDSRQCGADGTWTGDAPSCKIKGLFHCVSFCALKKLIIFTSS